MNRFGIIVIVLLLLSMGVKAQSRFKPGVGINFTNVTGEGADASGQLGWQAGASIAFGEKLYFEPGVFYQKSAFEFTTADNSPETDASYHGLRIPVAVGLNILGSSDSAFGLRIFGGGSSYVVMGSSSDALDKDDIESPQWGVFAGAGVDITIFYVDLSYQWSLSNVQSDIDDIDLGKTKGLFLTAGLRF